MKILSVLTLLIALPNASLAQDEMHVDSDIVTACFEQANWENPNPDCVGNAASACSNADGGTNDRGAAMCVAAESEVWEAIMAQALDDLRAKVADLDANRGDSMDPTLPKLEAAQTYWDDAQGRQCIFEEGVFADGTIGIVMGADCTMRAYAARAFLLKMQGDWF